MVLAQATSWSTHRKGDYSQTSNISRTLVGNNFADRSDEGDAPPTTSSFSTTPSFNQFLR